MIEWKEKSDNHLLLNYLEYIMAQTIRTVLRTNIAGPVSANLRVCIRWQADCVRNPQDTPHIQIFHAERVWSDGCQAIMLMSE